MHEKAKESCELIRSEVFEECRSIVDYSYFYKKCMHDYCTWGNEAHTAVCTHASALARACAVEGVVIPWNMDPQVTAICRESD